MSLVRDLRQRRLVQILIAYLAGGWIMLEVISQLVEMAIVPQLVYEIGLVWFLVGMVAALVVGWFHGEKGAQRAPPLEVGILAVLVVALVGFSGNVAWKSYQRHQAILSAAEGGLDPRRIAVMYFRDITRGGDLQYLADGLTEGLIGELATVRELDLISPNGVAAFRDEDIALSDVATELEAGTVVDGTVERSGDDVRIGLRLVDGASGAEFRRASLTRPVDAVFELQDEVVTEAARFLREWLGDELRVRRQERGTESPQAWALVQRAERAKKEALAAHAEGDPGTADGSFLRADSLLAVAEGLDPEWAEPVTLRAWVAYRRSRLAFDYSDDLSAIFDPIDAALAHAERALVMDPTDAAALEAQGTARYWLWHMGAYRDDVSTSEQAQLLLYARMDLERAVTLDPSLASAYVTLSHLYLNCDDRSTAAVALAAQRAYEEDAYLETASTVLVRLVDAYSSLEQFADARRWCQEGARRFPDQPLFTECRLKLMLSPALDPDPDQARALAARLDSLAETEDQRAYREVWNGIMVAGVLARAGMQDSARVVLDRAHQRHRRIADALDPHLDLLSIEAYVRHLAGEDGRAIELLQRYVAVNPGHSFDPAGGLHWWWRELSHDPRFQGLVALRASDN